MVKKCIGRILQGSIIVNGSLEAVWHAWTTPTGIKSFFAPDCRVDLRVNGAYEILFNLDAPDGERGGEGMRILAIQPMKMLSFMWNAPPELADVRGQRTHVMVEFESLTPTQTKVILTHDGWGVGGEWDQAYDYFSEAWYKIVLPRLKASFEGNPVKWEQHDGGETR